MNIWFEHLKYMYGSIIDNAFKTSYNQLYTLTKMKYKVQINILLHLPINLLVIKKKPHLYWKGIKAAAIEICLKDGKHVLLESIHVCDI